MNRGLAVILALSSVQLLACSETPDFIVSRFDVQQITWDTLTVSASFGELKTIGSEKAVIPDESWTTVFTAAYDTLFHGGDSVIFIQDKDLGDRETLIVEICGVHNKRQACEQRSVLASPKRLEPVTGLEFPENEAFDRGTFRLDYQLLRQVFGSEDWEVFERRIRPETYIMAYVEDRPQDAVKVPVRKTRNRFNLTRFSHYRDFRYQIKSQMMDSDSVAVSFDLYSRLNSDPVRVASDRVVLRAKSEEQRRAELAELVELAASQVLNRMKGFFGLRQAYVFINSWSYQPLERMYTSEIELHWKSGLRGEWFDMIGGLTVRSNGTAAQFEWIQGSSSAARTWVSRIDSSTVLLDALRPGSEMRPPQDETER